MLSESELKEALQKIASNDYSLPPEGHSKIIDAALRHIGSTDPILRDELIYATLARWIMRENLSSSEIAAILEIILDDDHLGFHLGESETDTVFTRSFSLLLLPPILIAHRERDILPAEKIKEVFSHVLDYLKLERDRRGFIPGKGWAHTIAHAADTLDDLALCEELGKYELLQIFAAILQVMSEADFVYTHEEDERMSIAATAVMSRGEITIDAFQGWLASFEAKAAEELSVPQANYRRINMKNFLRCLYFRLPRDVKSNRLKIQKAKAAQEQIAALVDKFVLY